MTGLETNVFLIENLDQLSAEYRLYRIKGLRPEQDEYYQNRQILIRNLSRELRSPITVIQRNDETYLVVRNDVIDVPKSYPLIRAKVHFELASDVLQLDFTHMNLETNEIGVRFLQFTVQEALYRRLDIWQPSAGRAFYEYEPVDRTGDIGHFRGFAVRVTPLPSGRLGICVDVTSKFVGLSPLPAQLSRSQFRRWWLGHFIYHFGYRWYEIQTLALDDRNCGEYEFEMDGQWVNLLDYVIRESRKPIPSDLVGVSKADSVILYKNNQGTQRAAISSLCYPVYGTEDDGVSHLHQRTILPPHLRRKAIHEFAQAHLSELRFGDTKLIIAPKPEMAPQRMFNVPDLEFGQSRVISVIGTEGAEHVSLDNLGGTRWTLLQDPDAGFYERSPLDRQYLIIPASVIQSYGEAFADDLKQEVERLYPPSGGYEPTLIPYDDRGPRTFTAQGRAILEAVEQLRVKSGYAVVMVHKTIDRWKGKEDALSGLVTRKLYEEFDIRAAVIHSEVPGASYTSRK